MRGGGSSYLHRALRRADFDLVEPVKAMLRALWKGSEVAPVVLRPTLRDAEVVLVLVIRDEAVRMPHFLDHYRRIGVDHFIVIDNDSSDGLRDVLREHADVSVFAAHGDYKASRYGCDWVNHVCRMHCRDKWVLWIDADEFLVFTGRAGVTLEDVAGAMDQRRKRSMQVLLLDMYSARNSLANRVEEDTDPLTVCNLYDRSGYHFRWDARSNTTWIKGGVRGRSFFDHVRDSPALNKTTMVKWRPHNFFLKSTHQLWPRRLNGPGELNGALLHFKFTSTAVERVLDPVLSRQHTSEYQAYAEIEEKSLVLDGVTDEYRDFSGLVDTGLIRPLLP